jgi:hypothetical protein
MSPRIRGNPINQASSPSAPVNCNPSERARVDQLPDQLLIERIVQRHRPAVAKQVIAAHDSVLKKRGQT